MGGRAGKGRRGSRREVGEVGGGAKGRSGGRGREGGGGARRAGHQREGGPGEGVGNERKKRVRPNFLRWRVPELTPYTPVASADYVKIYFYIMYIYEVGFILPFW